MVIYWFGFVDELRLDTRYSGILVADSFPDKDKIVFFDPEFKRDSRKRREEEQEDREGRAACQRKGARESGSKSSQFCIQTWYIDGGIDLEFVGSLFIACRNYFFWSHYFKITGMSAAFK